MAQGYRLQSTPLIYTPGVLGYARELYKADKATAVKLFHEGFGLKNEIAEALVAGKIDYTVEDEAVLFEWPETV